MVKQKDLADSLIVETIHEMADGYFSRRVNLEYDLEHVSNLADQVRLAGRDAQAKLNTLSLLLAGEAGGLFSKLSPGTPAVDTELGPRGEIWTFSAPWGLTAKGIFLKSLELCFEAASLACHAYREGAYEPDPRDERRKRLSPNLSQLTRLIDCVNDEVDSVNSNQSATCLLDFVKRLDPVNIERENVTGAVFHEDTSRLDRDLCFRKVSLESFGLPEIPELPKLEQAKEALREAGQKAYAARKDEINKLLKELSLARARGEGIILRNEID